MKFTHYLYIAPIALLAACSSEKLSTTEGPQPATEHPDGQILLTAGINEGNSAAATRAGAEDSHTNPGHLTLTTGTKLALRISGTWTGHSPETVVQTTTATVGAETASDSKHNSLTLSPVRYWDEYGTADEANATTGRAEGLTIFGAAVDGQTAIPTDLASVNEVSDESAWKALSWTLAADQSAGWAAKDLLISNNVQPAPGASTSNDGTYKFAERASGKLLEFRHAMSKITVNLTAGAGFEGGVFAAAPTVWLTSNEGSSTANTEWPYTTGTVDITKGAVTGQGAPAVVKMYNAAAASGYDATQEALVVPGSAFKKDAVIAKINADGNIYYVTSEKIRAAINASAHNTDDPTVAGKNYIINVTVNKTAIEVTATVTDWINVEAAEVSPVINVNADWGTEASIIDATTFSLYRSTSLDNGYSTKSGSYYPAESIVSKADAGSDWTMTPQLYWPNHNTHYQFRGVWPRTGTETGHPRVEDGTEDTNGCQVIKVQNVAYTANTFPSDLMIARPEIVKTEMCNNSEPGHTATYLYSGGICATEGKINLNFRYMMSQVEVILSTSGDTDPDKVELAGAVVEIVNIYNNGDVKLGDRTVVPTGSGSYQLDAVSGTGNENKRHSAIVPQQLTYTTPQADSNVRFKITITNTNGTVDTSDDTQDIYYADINPILKSGSTTEKVAPNGAWESGYHYVYNLKLTKTKVQVTATLTDWKKVEAGTDVWF